MLIFMPQIERLKTELKSCPYKEVKHHYQGSCYLCGLLIACFSFAGFLRWVMEIQRWEKRTTSLWAWLKLQKWFHIPEFNEFSVLLPLETEEVWVGERTKKDFHRNISAK